MVILGPRILCKEATRILIMTKQLIIGTGHARSLDAVPLKNSSKSTLPAHVLALSWLMVGTLGVESSPPHRLGTIHLIFEMLFRGLKS